MDKNIFEEFQAEKQRLIKVANAAKEFGWIDESREKEIVDKINKDVLTLGVIGQMKCGKSTFLNAFVFGDSVLPVATTPMTAALSVITYGPEKKLVAEFYSRDEWAEQKLQASRSIADVAGNTLEESKIKAAQELVAKSRNIPGNIDDYLGKTREDVFSNLADYVGVDGKFVAITKSVMIFYPHEYLKGVEIVDTPGFNDPIVSREEKTKDFLRKADVILLMLYASRAFDATDRTILFKNVRQCGIGKILIGVNKYDIAYGNGETEAQIIANVKEQIAKACIETGDDTMSALVTENEPIPFSAEMSLMSQLPMSVIQSNDSFSTSWKNVCDNFEISSQMEMAVKSRIHYLIDAIKKIIERDKTEVLLKKPTNVIKAAAQKKKDELDSRLREIQSFITNLQRPDEELEEKKSKIERAERRLKRKIQILGDDIESSFKSIIRKGKYDMEDAVLDTCKQMDRIVDDMKLSQDEQEILPRLETKQNILVQVTLRRIFEGILYEAKLGLMKCVRGFCEETEEVLLKYLDDFEARDFVKTIENKVLLDFENKNLFSAGAEEEADSDEMTFLNIVGKIITVPFELHYEVGKKAVEILSNNKEPKRKLHASIESIRRSFDVQDYLNTLIERKDDVINEVKTYCIDELLSPMQSQLEDILGNISDKEKALSEAMEKEGVIKDDVKMFNEQYNKIYL